MDLVNEKLGSDANVDISIENKKVIIKVAYAAGAVGGDLAISVDAKYLLEKLKALIPGNIDDVVIDFIETQVP